MTERRAAGLLPTPTRLLILSLGRTSHSAYEFTKMTGQFGLVETQSKAEFDPRKFLKPAMTSFEKLCA